MKFLNISALLLNAVAAGEGEDWMPCTK